MRIILTGAPGSGKSQKASLLASSLTPEFSLTPIGSELDTEHEVGQLADYRQELSMAMTRTIDHLEKDDVILYSSLLDSMAHSGARLTRIVTNQNVSDDEQLRWMLTSQIIAALLLDSFKHDLIFFVPGNDGTEFSKMVEIAIEKLLLEMQIGYTTLTNVEEAAKLVREYDKGRDNTVVEQQATG